MLWWQPWTAVVPVPIRQNLTTFQQILRFVIFLEVYDAERILSCMPWTAAATAYRGIHAEKWSQMIKEKG